MSRNTLHINRLQDFKDWLDSKGLKWRDRNIGYEVLQVQPRGSTQWWGIWRRDHMPEHYSVDSRMDGMVLNFLRETKDCRQPVSISTPPSSAPDFVESSGGQPQCSAQNAEIYGGGLSEEELIGLPVTPYAPSTGEDPF